MSMLTPCTAPSTAAPRTSLPSSGDTQAAGMVDGTRRSSGLRIILDRTQPITRVSPVDNKKQRYQQSFRRVDGWSSANDDILQAAPAPVAAHLVKLREVVVRIDYGATQQEVQHQLSTRSGTDATTRRADVLEAMRPITQVGRVLRGTVFGISTISKMPGNADNEHLVKAAFSMVENATIFRATLIEHGLQPNCIETLQTAAEALKASVDTRGLARSAGVGASKGLRTDISQGIKLVSLIDAGLQPLLRNNATKLASWRNAKRVTAKGVVGAIVPPALAVNAPNMPSVATETHAA